MNTIRVKARDEAIIKFISYDGKYPHLCLGTLVLELNGKRFEEKYFLRSGGECICRNGNYEVTQGDWSIHEDVMSEELRPYSDVITDWVNANIKKGCCGGCC